MVNLLRTRNRVVQVTSPCRIHFGLVNCGQSSADTSAYPEAERLFGGIGAMVCEPNVCVAVSASAGFSVSGELKDRAIEFAERWLSQFGSQIDVMKLDELPCSIQLQAPRDHIGVGTGTQLALSVAAALNNYFELPAADPFVIAKVMGRGQRSAVGIHGFRCGGFIYDKGRPCSSEKSVGTGSEIGPLEFHCPICPDWHLVLSTDRNSQGLMGDGEWIAFQNCPENDFARSRRLRSLIESSIVPAIQQQDFAGFAKSIGDYGRESGMYFAATQGGAYNGDNATRMVLAIRDQGFEGVGQSSWGPTIYTLVDSEAKAQNLAEWIDDQFLNVDSMVSRFDNQGAQLSVSKT